MGRSPSCWSCSKHEDLNRGAWTASEDKILSEYIKTHGVTGRWRSLPKKAGLTRYGKSCRLRWFNYLRPDIKRGNISPDEEDLLIRLHRLLGNRWALIAGRLPGRTDNEIKNYWNSHLNKRVQQGDFDQKFQKPLKSTGVPSYSNYDEEGLVDKDVYTSQGTPVETTKVERAVAEDDNLDTHDHVMNQEGGLKAADDDVVEIDTSKSWHQLLLECGVGDSQYNRLQTNNMISSTSSGTYDHHQSAYPLLTQSSHSSSCNFFDQEFPHSKDFKSSYFDSFLELDEPSVLIP